MEFYAPYVNRARICVHGAHLRYLGQAPNSTSASFSQASRRPATAKSRSSSGRCRTAKDDLQKRIEQLEGSAKAEADVFAAQKEEIEYLTHLTEAMMTVAGIFALFLAAASWTALEGQRKAAQQDLIDLSGRFDKDSRDSLAKLDRLRDELQLDFPMLGRIQSNFMSVLLSLRTACQSLVPRDDTYGGLNWKEKQDILFYENAITTALLLNTKGYEKELSEIYRLLGIFYGSRFNSTLVDNKFLSNPDTSDFDRAHFYFERAVKLDQGSYIAYFHAGISPNIRRSEDSQDFTGLLRPSSAGWGIISKTNGLNCAR